MLRALCLVILSSAAPVMALADDLMGTWQCTLDVGDFSGRIDLSFETGGTLGGVINLRSSDAPKEQKHFSINMVWKYQYDDGQLISVPVSADKARLLVDGENHPEQAKEMKDLMLSPRDIRYSVAFPAKHRMTLTDPEGVMKCRRKTRCEILFCSSND